MSEMKDITSMVFNFFTVIKRVENSINGRAQWLCKCVCGTEKVLEGKRLRSNTVKSCGCKTLELISNTHSTHRLSNSREYRSWAAMKNRCYNNKLADYKNYGGRGIIVCDRWLNSFENFFEDMGYRPTPEHSLERNDTNGIYEKSNCRWATDLEQTRNQRSNVWHEYKGVKKLQKDWLDYFGIGGTGTHIRYHLKKGRTITEIFDKFQENLIITN